MVYTLNDVLKTKTLQRRISRAADLTAENNALHKLSKNLLANPLDQLQSLLESALHLCSADSAGVSILETPTAEVFHWVAMAGKYRNFVGGTTPRRDSPCGVTLDAGQPQLFYTPGKYFACFEKANPPICEGLVLPIKGVRRDPGTIWIVSHSPKIEFDMEDVRVMSSLAGFAAFACSQLVGEIVMN